MIAVDTNILVSAHRRDAIWHERAAAVLRELAEGPRAWAVPWPCLHEFLSIVTHPRIYRPPTPLETALDQLAAWLVGEMSQTPAKRLVSGRSPSGEPRASTKRSVPNAAT